jgi:hypothetical protein
MPDEKPLFRIVYRRLKEEYRSGHARPAKGSDGRDEMHEAFAYSVPERTEKMKRIRRLSGITQEPIWKHVR